MQPRIKITRSGERLHPCSGSRSSSSSPQVSPKASPRSVSRSSSSSPQVSPKASPRPAANFARDIAFPLLCRYGFEYWVAPHNTLEVMLGSAGVGVAVPYGFEVKTRGADYMVRFLVNGAKWPLPEFANVNGNNTTRVLVSTYEDICGVIDRLIDALPAAAAEYAART